MFILDSRSFCISRLIKGLQTFSSVTMVTMKFKNYDMIMNKSVQVNVCVIVTIATLKAGVWK